MVEFFKTTHTGKEVEVLSSLLNNPELWTSRYFSKQCIEHLSGIYPLSLVRLTKSCTQALELACQLLDLKPGDEVIVPSYGFVSCVNAIALRGAKPVLVDVGEKDLCIDPQAVAGAITPDTRAILAIHYAGFPAPTTALRQICQKFGLYLIEDNAHGFLSYLDNHPLGYHGDIVTFSFDFLKPISCGEGGAIVVHRPELKNRLLTLYEMGTNRQAFLEGKTPFYAWQDIGSNHALSEYLAAVLWLQFQQQDHIRSTFKSHWQFYADQLMPLKSAGLGYWLEGNALVDHNGYMFVFILPEEKMQSQIIDYALSKQVRLQFHYTALHESPGANRWARISGNCQTSASLSRRMIRLPLHYHLSEADRKAAVNVVFDFFESVLSMSFNRQDASTL